MSDDQNWQSPGDPGATGGAWQQPPSWQQPPAWQQQPPSWQQQPPAWQQQPVGAQPGWAPPPKPGLVPLRPLSFGTLLAAPFQALRRNPRVTIGIALLLQAIPTIIVSVVITGGIYLLLARVLDANAADRSTLEAGAVGGIIVLGVLSAVISAVFGAILQGVIVGEVSRQTLGEKLTFSSLWRLVRGRIGALIGWTLLLALAWLVAIALVAAVVLVIAVIGGPAGSIGAVLAGVFGGLGLIALAVWVNTKLAIVPSALVLERLALRTAVARSWRLTDGDFWRTFGLIALIGLIVYSVTQIIAVPFGLLGAVTGTVFAPTSLSSADPTSFSQVIAGQLSVNVLSSIVGAIVGAVGSVVETAAVALLYLDLRMRKEGLDLDLVRYVEARQTGQELPDPFLLPAPGAGAPAAWPGR